MARISVVLFTAAWCAASRSPNIAMLRSVHRHDAGNAAPVAVNWPLRDRRLRIAATAVGSLGCALTRLGQDEREQPRALLAAFRAGATLSKRSDRSTATL